MFIRLAIILLVSLTFVKSFRAQNRSTKKFTSENMWPFNTKPEETGVAFIDAVLSKNVDEIKATLSRKPSALNDTTSNGWNAMHYISKLGHYKYPPNDIPKLLVDSKININAQNSDGKTPLVISLLSGWQKIAMLLLDNGADRTCVTNEVKQKITCPDCKRVVREYNL
jgi:ankyrin repeat protein